MTVLELIEEGLINDDWSYIREARQLLKEGKTEGEHKTKGGVVGKPPKTKKTAKKVTTEEVQVLPKKKTTKKSPSPKTKAGRPKKSRLIEPDPDSEDIDIQIARLEDAVVVEERDEEAEPVQSRPQPFKPRTQPNRFCDDGSLFFNDTAWQQANANKKPEPRTRPGSKMVKAKCHVCGKTVEVNPILAPKSIGEEKSFFKCNRCIGGGR